MDKLILNTVNQEFINSHLNVDIVSLLLKKTDAYLAGIKTLVEQIEAKNKCEHKLPTWFNTERIYYPNKLNIEQTSSEITAQYKSHLVKGNTLIDLTGGFGVDVFYFAKQFKQVTHCELDTELSAIATHNFETLGVSNINTIPENGIDYLKASNKPYDCIYIDPSRRHDSKGKVFYLKDCLPDVTMYLDLFFKHTKTVLIKASPMLDISIGLNELQCVKEVHVVAVENEVKELLFLLEADFEGQTTIKTNNLTTNNNQQFEFKISEEKNTEPTYNLPQTYLYEPNAALLKAGAFNILSKRLQIDKLQKHSHLYTSDKRIEFPGRQFKIIEALPYSKKTMAQRFLNNKANVSIRNFPETVAQIRAKYKLKDGGDLYLFFTTNMNNKKVVVVTKQLKK